jgi:PAS domain S-box-containing protein
VIYVSVAALDSRRPLQLDREPGQAESVTMSTLIETPSILLSDIGDRQDAEAGLFGHRLQSRALLEALPLAVYTTDPAGRITYFNQAAVELWGHRPVLGKSEWCGSWRLLWPDGSPMRHDECPMAVALRERRPIRGAEAAAERPDGTRVSFLAYPIPLWDDSGALVGAVNTLIDITERNGAEVLEQRLASIVESSDDAIVSKDLNGIIVSWNGGAQRLFGYTAEEAVGQPITMLIPPDRHDEEPEILARIRRGERVDHYETVRRRKDGSLVDISLTVSPVKNAAGRIVGASKIARDITERKRAQEQQHLLLREMNHRVKNLFTLAGGVVALSTRSARTAPELAEAVRARLGALSRAHDLTLPRISEEVETDDRSTTLHALVQVIISPFIDSADRVAVNGCDVPIGGATVTSFALLLHELASNAAKFGALSSPGGSVSLDCSIRQDELLLTWREHGGPRLNCQPANKGFGSLLTDATVRSQFAGQISRHWNPEGLIVHLSLSLDRLSG